MKDCPECSAVLEDNTLECPYCGSIRPSQMTSDQYYSLGAKAALIRARIVLAVAIIALVVNPLFITTFIATGTAERVIKKSSPNDRKVKRLCTTASRIAALAMLTSTILFFGWFINAVTVI